MAGRPAKTAPGRNAAEPIAQAAADLCAEAGAAAVTIRAVAGRAGVAPSAVIYHFRNREGVLAAAHAALSARIADWMAAVSDKPADGLSAEAHLAAAAIAFLREHRANLIALQELNRVAILTDLPLDDRAPGWAAVTRFWSGVAGRSDEATGGVWSVVMEGAVSLASLEADPLVRDALIVDLVHRAADRLAGRPLRVGPRMPSREAFPRPVRAAGRQKIVDAVIALIGEVGIGQLTHRAIAARAGVALGTVSGAYGDREAMIVDAFEDLRWRGVDAVVFGAGPPRHYLSAMVFTADGGLRTELALIHAVGAALVRNPDLGWLAPAVRQLREGPARQWLRLRGHDPADAIDAILWVAITAAVVERALCLPASARNDWVDGEADRHLAALFGASHDE